MWWKAHQAGQPENTGERVLAVRMLALLRDASMAPRTRFSFCQLSPRKSHGSQCCATRDEQSHQQVYPAAMARGLTPPARL